MKLAHNVKLSVFAHEGEDLRKISEALKGLCPFDLEKEKVDLKTSVATGFQERKITIFEVFLKKERQTARFLRHLKESISESHLNLIRSQAESRLDSELNFFIRLDKAKLLGENRFYLTDSGDCFHIKISLAAYPANRDAGLKVVEEWLKQAL
ncbi:hypothetical protein JW898_04825 [Candidatus Woesearchaeota archaeon]|nr:hypothetical protein [Candidatus Woesearchaeota archaeon]